MSGLSNWACALPGCITALLAMTGCSGGDSCEKGHFSMPDGEAYGGTFVSLEELCDASGCPPTRQAAQALVDGDRGDDEYHMEDQERCGLQVFQRQSLYPLMFYIYREQDLVGAVEMYDSNNARYGCEDDIYLAGTLPDCTPPIE